MIAKGLPETLTQPDVPEFTYMTRPRPSNRNDSGPSLYPRAGLEPTTFVRYAEDLLET